MVVRNDQNRRWVDTRLVRRIVVTLLAEVLRKRQFQVAVYVVSPAEITRLNETFLQHAGATDVITFAYPEPGNPELVQGEIFVCLEVAVAQAPRYRTTWQMELVRYFVHGVLHLCDQDDLEPQARRRMRRAEDQALNQLAGRFSLEKIGAPPPAATGKRRRKPAKHD